MPKRPHSSDPDRPAARLGRRGLRRRKELTKEELATRLNGIAVEDITEAPIPGIYQVAVGANVAYVTKDGRYIIRGDIYDAETSDNVSEETRARARATMLGERRPGEHDRVQAGERRGQAYDHDLHRHRLRLLPAIPSRDRQGHRARHRGSLPVLSAHGPEHRVVDEGRPGLVRGEPQLRAHAREARRRDPRRRPRARRRSRLTTSSASASACAARRRSSPRPASCSAATCRRRRSRRCSTTRTRSSSSSASPDGVDHFAGGVDRAHDADAARDRPRRRQHHLHQHSRRALARSAAPARAAARPRLRDGHAHPAAAAADVDHAAAGDAVLRARRRHLGPRFDPDRRRLVPARESRRSRSTTASRARKPRVTRRSTRAS